MLVVEEVDWRMPVLGAAVVVSFMIVEVDKMVVVEEEEEEDNDPWHRRPSRG
jgi:hypothetical protein